MIANMSNSKIRIAPRPQAASDTHLAAVHEAFATNLTESGKERLSSSAFEPNSFFAAISGRRLRVVAPQVAATLAVGKELFIEFYPPVIRGGDTIPAHTDYIVSRPRQSPISSETISITPPAHPYDSLESWRSTVNREDLPVGNLSAEDLAELHEKGEELHEMVGYDTVSTAEADALLQVANTLRQLTRPGLSHYAGQIGLAWGTIQGFYRPDDIR